MGAGDSSALHTGSDDCALEKSVFSVDISGDRKIGQTFYLPISTLAGELFVAMFTLDRTAFLPGEDKLVT